MMSLGATEKPCMKSKNHLVYFVYISIISAYIKTFYKPVLSSNLIG